MTIHEQAPPDVTPLEHRSDAELHQRLRELSVDSEVALRLLPDEIRDTYIVDYENPYVSSSMDMQRTRDGFTDDERQAHAQAIKKTAEAFVQLMTLSSTDLTISTCFTRRNRNWGEQKQIISVLGTRSSYRSRATKKAGRRH